MPDSGPHVRDAPALATAMATSRLLPGDRDNAASMPVVSYAAISGTTSSPLPRSSSASSSPCSGAVLGGDDGNVTGAQCKAGAAHHCASRSHAYVLDVPSLCVVYFVTLVSEGARGLLLPSTWAYVQSMGGGREVLGWVVGVLSLGRMLVTVPLGWLSDRYSAATVFHVSAAVQVAGHALYAAVPLVPAAVASRLVVGLGSSTLSVARAYVARAVPPHRRTAHYAYLSATQFVGFAVLPGLGSALARLPHRTLFGGVVVLNGYTYPAVVLAAACVVSSLLVALFYKDPPPPPPPPPPPGTLTSVNSTTTTSAPISTSSKTGGGGHDWTALLVCTGTNMVFRGTVAELETVMAAFLSEGFGVAYGDAGGYMAWMGLCGLAVYAALKPATARMSDRALLALGLAVNVWCAGLLTVVGNRVALPVYVALMGALWAVAYPVGQTAGLGLYSKALRTLPPGALLGLFSATGSGARIAFAVAAAAIWGAAGRPAVFASMFGLSVAAAVAVRYNWRRLDV